MTSTIKPPEAAEFLGISYWKLLELAKAGKVPHIRLPGRILFRRESLERWLEEQEQASVQRESAPVGKIRQLR
ncbi:MAG: helix-turn-helix domain-containing protein [Firmicutes bacterium]|nr:helix-turn-helix domain-containing protein [Bacillota bacterium]